MARSAVGTHGSKRESAGLAQAALPSPHARDLQTGHKHAGIHLRAGPGGAFTALVSSTEEDVGLCEAGTDSDQCFADVSLCRGSFMSDDCVRLLL